MAQRTRSLRQPKLNVGWIDRCSRDQRWLSNIRGVREIQAVKADAHKDFRSTPGGTRTPNLLIRRSPRGVHSRPQPSTAVHTARNRRPPSPQASTPVHSRPELLAPRMAPNMTERSDACYAAPSLSTPRAASLRPPAPPLTHRAVRRGAAATRQPAGVLHPESTSGSD